MKVVSLKLVNREPSIVSVSINCTTSDCTSFLLILYKMYMYYLPPPEHSSPPVAKKPTRLACPAVAKKPSHNPIKVIEQVGHELLAIVYFKRYMLVLLCYGTCDGRSINQV